jgi:hypothetical protein
MAKADLARAGSTIRCAIYTRKSSDEGLDWTLPAARAKNATEYQIPLSDSAVQILQALPRIAGSDWRPAHLPEWRPHDAVGRGTGDDHRIGAEGRH